ncbi:ClC family H(+)/Cl(-) exchange transporter [Sebaldella sp. S0638]|uniref:ClC family H(+)/Cl(-) exchange transporter n=1 Tax=Sebaldella sp. S0638 TaxID=2957809 RepID=UPI0020A0084A|nr:ClC family H(+)/Cl(-) exchange transporter [Sebaldella sp. S0638]MCP1224986.1 ClC family H(+)/Cl(-) exchange transporter [Sebaldella sp. S0638]
MKNDLLNLLTNWQKLKSRKHNLLMIFYSLLTGIFAGLVVIIYRLGLDEAGILRERLFNNLSIVTFFTGIIIFVFTGFILQFLVTKFPLISGSGIPQVKALLMQKIRFRWLPELILKFFGGLLSIGIGLSLGREGPSIHLGALVGEGINEVTGRSEMEKKYFITCGASAGLAAAFNAPLAGVVFALEELHKFFSPLLLICTLIASITADFLTRIFLGYHPVFNFEVTAPAEFNPLMEIFLVLIFGIIMSFMGKLFSDNLVRFQKIYKKINLNPYLKVTVLMLTAFFTAFLFKDITGGGHDLIEKIAQYPTPLLILFLLLTGKFLYTLVSYSSGFPGGIFLPMLVIGALLGKIYGIFIVDIFGVSDIYITHYIILGMAAYFTAVVRAPITGIILILEMTGNFSHLFALTFIAAVSYVITEFINLEPVYDVLFNNMSFASDNIKKEKKIITVTIPVIADSRLSDKMVKDLTWPADTLLAGIRRDGHEFIPNGNTVLKNGDLLVILTDKEKASIITYYLYEMGTIVKFSKKPETKKE